MPYQSATSDVREEAENILEIDFSNTEIQEEQAAAYDLLAGEIGEYDANSSRLAGIKKLEIKLAASFVLDHFKQYKEKAKEKLDDFYRLLETFKKGMTGTGADISDRHATTSYQSYSAARSEDPEQTTVLPYTSIKPGYYYGMGTGGKTEPWQKPYYFYDRVITPRC